MNFSENCTKLFWFSNLFRLLGRKTIFVNLPQLQNFLRTFHRLALLIKTINTYVISFWP